MTVVQRQLLLEQADSAGIGLTTDDWTMMRVQQDSALALLASVLNLSAQTLRDSAATPVARAGFAQSRVQDYLERVVRGRARFYPIPPFLGATLRARGTWRVDQAGIRRALEQAKELRAGSDSLTAQGAPRMRPAPGPAPVDTTSRRPPAPR